MFSDARRGLTTAPTTTADTAARHLAGMAEATTTLGTESFWAVMKWSMSASSITTEKSGDSTEQWIATQEPQVTHTQIPSN
jgi:hypothetical protein